MKIPYLCKFCGWPETVTIPDDELDMIHVEKWKPSLACNPCADYMHAKRRIQDRIERACAILVQLRVCGTAAGQSEEIRAEIRTALTKRTKQFASIVCRHFRKAEVWEPDFVDMLMEQPDKWITVLGQYVRGISGQQSRKP